MIIRMITSAWVSRIPSFGVDRRSDVKEYEASLNVAILDPAGDREHQSRVTSRNLLLPWIGENSCERVCKCLSTARNVKTVTEVPPSTAAYSAGFRLASSSNVMYTRSPPSVELACSQHSILSTISTLCTTTSSCSIAGVWPSISIGEAMS